jgi:hypothetical protein
LRHCVLAKGSPSLVPLQVNGAANILDGVHTWNLANGNGGTGIEVNSDQTRMQGCYLDYTDLVLTSLTRQTFTDGFFLVGASAVLRPSGKQDADGLYFAGNEFVDVNTDMVVDESQGTVGKVNDVYIEGSLGAGSRRLVTATLTATAPTSGTVWTADFSGVLAFPSAAIVRVSYALIQADGSLAAPLPVAVALPPSGLTASVRLSTAWNGTVLITAGQSTYTSTA